MFNNEPNKILEIVLVDDDTRHVVVDGGGMAGGHAVRGDGDGAAFDHAVCRHTAARRRRRRRRTRRNAHRRLCRRRLCRALVAFVRCRFALWLHRIQECIFLFDLCHARKTPTITHHSSINDGCWFRLFQFRIDLALLAHHDQCGLFAQRRRTKIHPNQNDFLKNHTLRTMRSMCWLRFLTPTLDN